MLSSQHILALCLVPGLTSEAIRHLIASGLSFGDITDVAPDALLRFGITMKTWERLQRPAPFLEEAERQMACAASAGARIVQFPDDDYPALLREIYAPPISLFVKGELLEEDHAGLAIVGTRRATMYGRLATEKFAGEFARAGVTVVSGLARGIDTFAHTGAMKAGGRTVAVVASGLDRIQPYDAAGLAEKIAEQGAVVSEQLFGVRALRPFFPQRNRIVSGMTRGTVVIESDDKGGALITAGFALDQNRDVFALPGPITSPRSNGTNELIRTDRARLTRTPRDVLDALGYCVPVSSVEHTNPAPESLTLFERRVFDVLDGEPVHVDDLCTRSGLRSNEVLVALLGLEFKGLARQMAGKMFLRS